MRKAVFGWEDDYGRKLLSDWFQRGRAASTIFHHPMTHVRVVVRGDDFTVVATELELYDFKLRGFLGSGKCDVREIGMAGKKVEVDRGRARARSE